VTQHCACGYSNLVPILGVCRALNMGKKGKIAVEDILHLIRNDPKKHGRVKELLISNDEIKKARKGFEEDKYRY